MSFSQRTGWPRTLNRFSARLDELRRQRALIDLTESNPTRCGLSDAGVVSSATDAWQPEPLGSGEAHAAVARWYGRPQLADSLLLTASTSEADGFLFKLLGDPGDEVLVPHPGYPLFEPLAQLESLRAVGYPLRYDGQWRHDVPVIDSLRTSRTRALVVVSPGNPTGCRLADDEALALGRWCADHGLALIIDEVFEHPRRSLVHRAWPSLTFVLGGLSKAAGLPQLKLGWVAVLGPEALRLEALRRLEVVADTYLSVSGPVQHDADRLLARAAPFRARVEQRCAINRQTLRALLPHELLAAEAGWSAVLRVPLHPDEQARALALLELGVVVHPGHFFDFPEGAHLVVSLLPEPSVFEAGARLIASSLRG